MTMDRTLKTHGSLARTRCVHTRAERIAALIEEGKFDPETDSPFGLPKVKVRHSRAGTKTKKTEAPAEAEEVKPEEQAPAAEEKPEQADKQS